MLHVNGNSQSDDNLAHMDNAVDPLMLDVSRSSVEFTSNFDPELMIKEEKSFTNDSFFRCGSSGTQMNKLYSKIDKFNRLSSREGKKLNDSNEDSNKDLERNNICKTRTVLGSFNNGCENLRVLNDNDSVCMSENENDENKPKIETRINEDGTTSNYFDKRKIKIAPRSTLQFKVGPPFEVSRNSFSVTNKLTKEIVEFEIHPRIDRGFDFIDDEWVGYKRNYFTLVASFQILDKSFDNFIKDSYELKLDDNSTYKVNFFAIKINARSDEDYSEISLVQHTAKRDKGPQFAPTKCPLIPSSLPNHQTIREASNVRNTAKMKKYDSTFNFHREQESYRIPKTSILNTYPSDCIQKVARYERVQFASSINIKNPSQKNKHFRLHVTLGAIISSNNIDLTKLKDQNIEHEVLKDGTKEYFFPVKELKTPPLIIRGRSPANYTSYNTKNSAKEKSSSKSQLASTPNSSLKNKANLKESDKKRSSSFMDQSLTPLEGSHSKEIFPRVNNLNSFPTVIGSKFTGSLEQIENAFCNKKSFTIKTTSNYSTTQYSLDNANQKSAPKILPSNLKLNTLTLKENNFGHYHNESYLEDKTIFVGSLILQESKVVNTADENILRKRRKLENKFFTSPDNQKRQEMKKEVRKLFTTSPPTSSPYHKKLNEEAENITSLSFTFQNSNISNCDNLPSTSGSDLEIIPRIFNRVLNDSSFLSHYHHKNHSTSPNVSVQQSYELRKKNKVGVTKGSCLPSEVVTSGNFLDEPSFYKQ